MSPLVTGGHPIDVAISTVDYRFASPSDLAYFDLGILSKGEIGALAFVTPPLQFGDLNELCHAIRMQVLGATYGGDHGDECDARPQYHIIPQGPDGQSIEDLLAELGVVSIPSSLFDLIRYAESMRRCCRHCASIVDSEDGS